MFALPPNLIARGLAVRPSDLGDHSFLRALFATARLDAPFLAHWPADQREPFLDEQFRFQDIHYRTYYGAADFLVLERHGVPIGRLILDQSAPDWLLVDIALSPAVRGQGIGTVLMQAILAAATRAGATSVHLQVEAGNKVRALYERLGFAAAEDTGTHTAMIWTVPR